MPALLAPQDSEWLLDPATLYMRGMAKKRNEIK